MRRGLLSAAWSVAVLGIVTVFWTRGTRHWPRVVLYVLMGWMCVVAAGQLAALPAPAIRWLLAGGVVYTVGAVVYLANCPSLWPGRFAATTTSGTAWSSSAAPVILSR